MQTLVLTEAEQSAEKEIEEITLAYGNGTLTDNMDALPFIAAAFAAKTGKTADELTEVDLTAKALRAPHGVRRYERRFLHAHGNGHDRRHAQ